MVRKTHKVIKSGEKNRFDRCLADSYFKDPTRKRELKLDAARIELSLVTVIDIAQYQLNLNRKTYSGLC